LLHAQDRTSRGPAGHSLVSWPELRGGIARDARELSKYAAEPPVRILFLLPRARLTLFPAVADDAASIGFAWWRKVLAHRRRSSTFDESSP
jgi:hypothetical protein